MTKRAVAASGAVPLGLRLPNPPPLFVGRHKEALFLREAIKRAPVSIVWGPGGLGKTSLVLHTLHRYFAKRVPNTLFVGLRPAAAREDLRATVIRALAAAAGASQEIDWPRLLADPGLLTATLIDVAEAGSRWLVLEDAHHGHPRQLGELLKQVARYARRSRWIVVSRADPGIPELADQLLALEGMSRSHLEQLARRCAPRLPKKKVQQAIAACGGSPWLVRQALLGGQGGIESRGADFLDGLPDGALLLLEAMAVVERPLPLESVSALSDLEPLPLLLKELERRGLVEDTGPGWRLHDVTRALLRVRPGPVVTDGLQERVALALAARQDSAALLEGLRLLLAQDRIEPARMLLEKHGDGLLKEGYAPELWSSLEPVTDGRLEGWRLRAAVEMGSPEALSRAREPRAATLRERFFWAKVLAERGEASLAVKVFAEVHDQAKAAGDLPLASEAGALRCQYLTNLGCTAEATAALRDLVAPTLDACVRRDAMMAWCLIALGNREEPLRLIEAMRATLVRASPSARREANVVLVAALLNLGRLREAWELSNQVKAELEDGNAAFPLHLFGRVLLTHAAIAIERGLLAEAKALLWGRLAPFAEPSTHQGLVVRMSRAKYRLWVGETKGLDEQLDELLEEARRLGLSSHHAFITESRLRLHLLEAEPLARVSEGARSLEPARLFSEPVELLQMEARARRGEKTPYGRGSNDVAEPSRNADLAAQARKVAALEVLAAGDAETALVEISEGIRVLREAGFGPREAEALHGKCEILLALDRRGELADSARSLARLAESFPSPRFALEARFFLSLVSEERIDPATLEELAAAGDVAPIAARRALALLGGSPSLDAIDRIIIDRVRAGWGATVQVGPGARGRATSALPAPPRWGLDAHRRSVWLQGGRRVDLSQHALLWNVLEVLADNGGAASKEQMACQVWRETQYHPLRHDNKLQLAIRKLRKAIEDEPSRPQLLLTTPEGYSLGGEVLRLPGSQPPLGPARPRS